VRRLAFAAALLLGAAACSSGQDPGIEQQPTNSGPSTSSGFLQPCPPGGPDATTPPAGCLDPEGNVVRP
jgi:hypothetical protein